MKVVGEKLEEWALNENNNRVQDLFGRSAFNRFYYASFLITRETLGQLKPNWKYTQHSEIPNLLVKALRTPVKQALKMAVRKGTLSPSQESILLTKLNTASTELASLLREAYEIRVVADYKPEIAKVIDKNVISLEGCKLKTATGWASRASAYCKVIRQVWGDCGLA